jgi:hypothetical protein
MDANAGAAAFLNCCEIVNSSRTFSYMQNGIKPPSLTLYGDCGCSNLRQLIDCGEDPYETPATDPAPWWDATIPESYDFAGFMPVEFNGLSSIVTRNVTEVISGGGVLGRLRFPPRTLTWRGFLIGKTCCATAYGLRWLTQQLLQTSCDSSCQGFDLTILICCPDNADSCNDVNDPMSDAAWRDLKNVGLLNGPTILSERKTDCGCGCSSITEIEFSLVAGQSQLYKEPIIICDCVNFPTAPVECVEWIKIFPGEECPPADECPPAVRCNENPNCPNPVLPTIATVIDPCVVCDPIDPVSLCCHIDKENFGVFFEGVPKIEIYSGSLPLTNVRIDFFEDAKEAGCSNLDACGRCATLTVTYVPPFSTVIIDGTIRRVQIDCPGQGSLLPAENLTISPFHWPVLSCIDYCICFTADATNIAPDACVTVSVVPREN